MRIAFSTLGCKINQYETDLMQRDLASKGNTIVSFDEEADVYIVNTCSVTAKSDYQSRQVIRSAARRARGGRVVVTGCYASTRPEEIKKLPGVSLVINNLEKPMIHDYLTPEDHSPAGAVLSLVTQNPKEKEAHGRTRGYLKIQDGCDNACSYCIVPLARGRSRSTAPGEVLKEFTRQVRAGCPEIVLTGIHIGRYGADLSPAMDLTELLTTLVPARDGSRVRLSSIEPKEITGAMIGLLGNGLCRHLHIPLQSGDDTLLFAMKRDYTSGFYLDLVQRISNSVSGVALGADVMVGFPGEGDAEFQNTVKLIEQSPLTHLHVFSFSARQGTEAAGMKDQVPEAVKKQRSEAIRELGKRKNLFFRQKCLGLELNVIVEDKMDAASGFLSGLTDNYIRIAVRGAKAENIGKNIKVRISEVNEESTVSVIC
jgi:threonylcarbamoyladenosine tRNA methylthiotransferase MtaB